MRKNKINDQLVKYKDIGQYLLLYISIDHEKSIQCSWVIYKEEEKNMIKPLLLYEILTDKT